MSWIDTLDKLFSQKIIIKKMPGSRIKTIDFNKIQSLSADSMSGYKRLQKGNILGAKNKFSIAADIEQIEALRQQLYLEYSVMDTDPILSAALDVYADECTAKSPQGYMLTIKSDNVKVKKVLYNLFYDILNIEFNLWSWVRTTCKFGDLMLHLDIQPSVGIINAIPIHPGFIRRNDYAGPTEDQTEFSYEGPNGRSIKLGKFKDYEIAHFRLLSDTDFIPYGKSMLDGARKVYKQLVLMEDAMLLFRIMRAPERRVIKVDVGNLPPESIDAYIEKISNEMKKVPFMYDDGTYNLRYNLMNMLEDYYLPMRNGETGTDIQTLDGLKNDGAIEDIEYIRDKMMSYLKIPKAFLGYQQASDVKSSLASEDIRFARTTERIQKIFNSELLKIALIHLKIQGFQNEDLLDFEIQLSPPSMIYERQKVDLLNEKVNLIQNIRENKLWSRKRIYEELFDMSESEWKNEIEQIALDLREDFRFKQIDEEGNDPKITKRSFGTPHDIASMHMASKFSSDDMKKLYTDDEREENIGRPEKPGSFGRAKDPGYGLDPTGGRELDKKVKKIENIISKIPLALTSKDLDKLYDNKEDFDNIDMLNEDILTRKV